MNDSNSTMEQVKEMVWRAYEISIDPSISSEERQKALQVCDEFKNQTDVCLPLALKWAHEKDAKSCFFGLHCLEHIIKARWSKFTPEYQLGIRMAVLDLLRTPRSEQYLSNMLSRCLSLIIERDWPRNWPDMLQQLEAVGEITAIRIFFEEVFLYESMDVAKRRSLSAAIKTDIIPALVPQLLRILSSEFNSSATSSQISTALDVLFPIVQLLCRNMDIVSALGSIILRDRDNCKQALECIKRILDKNGRKDSAIVDNLLPMLQKMKPTHDDMLLMECCAGLICALYNYHSASLLSGHVTPLLLDFFGIFLTSEEFALEQTDLYFDSMNIICDPSIVNIWDDRIDSIVSLACNLSIRSVGKDADADESRNLARIRTVTQKACYNLLINRPVQFGEKLLWAIINSQWKIATFLLQSIEVVQSQSSHNSGTDNSHMISHVIGEVINTAYAKIQSDNLPLFPDTSFVQLAFSYCSADIQDKMLSGLLSLSNNNPSGCSGKNEQERMSVILSLSRNPKTVSVCTSRVQLLLEKLASISDCLAASILVEAILLLIKNELNVSQSEAVMDMILQPCNILLSIDSTSPSHHPKTISDGNSGPDHGYHNSRSLSLALHLLAATARSIADTEIGRIKLMPYLDVMYAMAACSQTNGFNIDLVCSQKALEFIEAFILAGVFFKSQQNEKFNLTNKTGELLATRGCCRLDGDFAHRMLNHNGECSKRFELFRSVVRHLALPIAAAWAECISPEKPEPFSETKEFLEVLLLNMPGLIEQAYLTMPVDLTPEQDSEFRQILALLSRDLADVFRRLCTAPSDSKANSFSRQPNLIASCLQSMYMFHDSFAVQRMIPICARFVGSVKEEDSSRNCSSVNPPISTDMEIPSLICCLRSLQRFIITDRETLAHDLLVMSSHLLDSIIANLGLDECCKFLQTQVSAEICRDDLVRYYDSIRTSDVCHDKLRKRSAETLLKKIFDRLID